MKIRKRYIALILFCIYMVAVALVCFMRPESIPEMRPDLFDIPIDKVVHFIMFFPYPILAYKAFRPEGKSKWIHLVILVIIFITGIGLAMGTEKIQGMSEYRSFEMEDFYADVLGMEISALLTAIYIFVDNKQERKLD